MTEAKKVHLSLLLWNLILFLTWTTTFPVDRAPLHKFFLALRMKIHDNGFNLQLQTHIKHSQPLCAGRFVPSAYRSLQVRFESQGRPGESVAIQRRLPAVQPAGAQRCGRHSGAGRVG